MSVFSQIAQITDNLYLSSAYAITRERLLELRISHIINCTLEEPSENELNIPTTFLQIGDNPQSRLDEHFDRIADEINDVIARDGKVLVHCLAGVSRSSTICIAYLMKYAKMTLKEAHSFVKSKRKVVYPNAGFWKQLVEYEMKLYGTNTVRMVPSNEGLIPDLHLEGRKTML